MKIREVFQSIKTTRGSIAKKEILLRHGDNELFMQALRYSLDPYIAFNVVKVPKTKDRPVMVLDEKSAWNLFFKTAKSCAERRVTGSAAVDALSLCFHCVDKDDEYWMRKVLKKHLAIGISTKTVNSVFPDHVPTFDVALAQKYEFQRIKTNYVGVEPKLDGIRCEGIVINGEAKLYSRAGKQITNFDDTIGKDLSQLPDGVYEGEIMGEDFTALMRQAYRKESINTSGTYLAVFDFIPLKEWQNKKSSTSSEDRYHELVTIISGSEPESTGMHKFKSQYKNLKIVERKYVSSDSRIIDSLHDKYVSEGFEGAMIKDPSAPYSFKRDWSVMKLKSFHDVDLPIKQLLEGTGKHSGKLGSFVVDYKGVEVQVGSGLSDALRESIWKNPKSFLGRIIEVRYQEETPDGSLRFPTFVCFRNDR